MFCLDRRLGSLALAGGRTCVVTTSVTHHHRHVLLLRHSYMSLPIEVVLFLPVTVLLMADHSASITLRLIYTMPQLLFDSPILLGLELIRGAVIVMRLPRMEVIKV